MTLRANTNTDRKHKIAEQSIQPAHPEKQHDMYSIVSVGSSYVWRDVYHLQAYHTTCLL